jgi:hypothetical protein
LDKDFGDNTGETVAEQRPGKAVKLMEIDADLNFAQKVALSEVGHYGYDLTFIRNTLAGKLVNGKVMTIDHEGEIEPNPKTTIRP